MPESSPSDQRHMHDDGTKERLLRLVSPYDIADMEFEGLSPSECFALGLEWGTLLTYVRAGHGGTFSLHRQNRARFEAMATLLSVRYEYFPGGSSGVTVYGRIPSHG